MGQAQKWGVISDCIPLTDTQFHASPNCKGGPGNGLELCVQEVEEMGW